MGKGFATRSGSGRGAQATTGLFAGAVTAHAIAAG